MNPLFKIPLSIFPHHGPVAARIAVTILACFGFLGSAGSASADFYAFDSLARIVYDRTEGGIYYYDLSLQSLDPVQGIYREIYVVMDRSIVVHGDAPALPGDVQFMSAEVTSEPGIDLWISSDRRSFANMNNYDWLDDLRMDLYDPNVVDPLAPGCLFINLEMGTNRQLTVNEMYSFGYWAGDLRGMKIEGAPFTESDGGPVPEPGSLLLLCLGGVGLHRKLRKL